MQHNPTLAAPMPPDRALSLLIDTHGAAATLRALGRVLLTRRRARRNVTALTAHLRADVGLPPAPETRHYWEIR